MRKDAKFCCDGHRVMFFTLTHKYKFKPYLSVRGLLHGIDINEWILTKVLYNSESLERIEALLKNKRGIKE